MFQNPRCHSENLLMIVKNVMANINPILAGQYFMLLLVI